MEGSNKKEFDSKVKFEQIFERLQYLEKWLEVAIRPSCRERCDPEDFDLFDDDHTGSVNSNNIRRVAK